MASWRWSPSRAVDRGNLLVPGTKTDRCETTGRWRPTLGCLAMGKAKAKSDNVGGGVVFLTWRLATLSAERALVEWPLAPQRRAR